MILTNINATSINATSMEDVSGEEIFVSTSSSLNRYRGNAMNEGNRGKGFQVNLTCPHYSESEKINSLEEFVAISVSHNQGDKNG